MRILRIIPGGPDSAPLLRVLSHQSCFKTAIETLRKKGLLYPNMFAPSMQKLGYECFETIFDSLPLQKLWCNEHGKTALLKHPDWKLKVLEEQVRVFQPDILYFERASLFLIPSSFRVNLKKLFPSIQITTGFLGTQLNGSEQIKLFSDLDCVFVGDEALRDLFVNARQKAFVVSHAFDFEASLFSQMKTGCYDLVFLGSSGYGFGDHQQRYNDLAQILEAGLLESWVSEPRCSLREKIRYFLCMQGAKLPLFLLKAFQSSIWPNKISRLALDSANSSKSIPWYFFQKPLQDRFPRKVHAPLFGIDYLEKLAAAKIVFNAHVDHSQHAGNMRCFETTGIGSCLLTDRAKHLRHLFTEDREIVGYSSIPEAIEKIKFLLDHDSIRRSIAKCGQERTLKEHTTWHRCQMVHEHLKGLL